MLNDGNKREEKIKVLIVDDHEIIRDSLRRMIDTVEDFQIVGICENGFEAFEKAKETNPDIVLIDAIMPKCNGVEGTRLIKGYSGKIKVLMLTTFSDDDLIFNSFRAGVDGYILKDVTAEKLINYINDCADGNFIIPNNIAVKLVEKVTSKEKNVNLFNETEKEIIPLIIRGLSNKEISTIINISYGTTRNYISEIYRKIGQNERNIAIEKLKEYAVDS